MTDTHLDGRVATDQPYAWHSAAGAGEAWWFFDSLMVVRSERPGQPVIIEATVAPGGGAPLHVHADLDDSFYLVSGRLAMRCGEQAFAVGPGGYVALPHACRTPSAWWVTSPPSCSRCTRMTRSCVSSGPPGGRRRPGRSRPPGRQTIWTPRSRPPPAPASPSSAPR